LYNYRCHSSSLLDTVGHDVGQILNTLLISLLLRLAGTGSLVILSLFTAFCFCFVHLRPPVMRMRRWRYILGQVRKPGITVYTNNEHHASQGRIKGKGGLTKTQTPRHTSDSEDILFWGNTIIKTQLSLMVHTCLMVSIRPCLRPGAFYSKLFF